MIYLTLIELSLVQSLTVLITQVSASDVFGEVGLELTISNDSLSEYIALCNWTKYVPNKS